MNRTFVLLFVAVTAVAQTIEVKSLWQPARVDGAWKLYRGDDPRFASPDFDDTGWETHSDSSRQLVIPRGAVWVRFHVRLPDQRPAEELGILLPPLGPSYDVFVNGASVGSFGDPRASNGWGERFPTAAVFPVTQMEPSASVLTVAIRIWRAGSNLAFQIPGQQLAWIGTREAIAGKRREMDFESRWRTVGHLPIMSATLLAGLFFVLLPLWRSDAPEYFWCGLFVFPAVVSRIPFVTPWIVESYPTVLVNTVLLSLGLILIPSWQRLFRILFAKQHSWLMKSVFRGLLSATVAGVVLLPFRAEWLELWLPVYGLLLVVVLLFGYMDLARGTKGGNNIVLMHISLALYSGSNIIYYGLQAQRSSGLGVGAADIENIALGVRGVGLLLFTMAMAVVLNRRSARLLGEQQRLRQELEAAAETQALLLPAQSVQVPGLTTEASYLPMSEVGGDFHYALRDRDSLIVLVGDISGKGLRAAMLVAVVIGILRKSTERSPVKLLEGMNQALEGQTRGGFVTCCCARFDPDGSITVANAGHVAPYLDGVEIAVQGFPLGLAVDSRYEEHVVRGEGQFTMVSDGVVEAADARSELFGFERTREISQQSAHEIAEAARVWGQNDDITVVTVQRTASSDARRAV